MRKPEATLDLAFVRTETADLYNKRYGRPKLRKIFRRLFEEVKQLERIHRQLTPIQAATADAAHDFPLAHRALEDLGISF